MRRLFGGQGWSPGRPLSFGAVTTDALGFIGRCSVLGERRRSPRRGKSEERKQSEHVVELHEGPLSNGIGKARQSGAILVSIHWVVEPSRELKTREGLFGTGDFLSPVLLHDQDHAGAQNGYVLVVASQGRDGRLVGGGNRIERFARLHFVMKNAGLLLGIFIRTFR